MDGERIQGKMKRTHFRDGSNSEEGRRWNFVAQRRSELIVGHFWEEADQSTSCGSFMVKICSPQKHAGRYWRFTEVATDPSDSRRQIEEFLMIWIKEPTRSQWMAFRDLPRTMKIRPPVGKA
jgi:hypothetical protein